MFRKKTLVEENASTRLNETIKNLKGKIDIIVKHRSLDSDSEELVYAGEAFKLLNIVKQDFDNDIEIDRDFLEKINELLEASFLHQQFELRRSISTLLLDINKIQHPKLSKTSHSSSRL